MSYTLRSNIVSLRNGVYNANTYRSVEKRRTTSIGVCFFGWLMESVVTVLIGVWMLLQNLGLKNIYIYPYFEFFNAIFRAILISFVHIVNDEDTKTVITDENWYTGIKHALGLYNKPDDQSI